MRAFETINYGGVDWFIWGKTDDYVYLCTVRSVYRQTPEIKDEYKIDYKKMEEDIEKYLKGKFAHKICSNGADYESLYGPLKILDYDVFKNITRMGFALPALKEDRFLLSVKSDGSTRNYMMQADNNGDVHQERDMLTPGVRATAVVKRTAFDEETNALIDIAEVAYDKTNSVYTGRLGAKKLDVMFRREHPKGRISVTDKIFRLKMHIVICPSKKGSGQSLVNEVKDIAAEPQNVCTIKDCVVEMCAVQPEYCYVLVNASLHSNPEEIVNNVKMCLTPQSLREDMSFIQKKLKKNPDYWNDGYLVCSDEIPMSLIQEYVEFVGGKTI